VHAATLTACQSHAVAAADVSLAAAVRAVCTAAADAASAAANLLSCGIDWLLVQESMSVAALLQHCVAAWECLLLSTLSLPPSRLASESAQAGRGRLAAAWREASSASAARRFGVFRRAVISSSCELAEPA
jgi:hypothetical protein